MTRTGPELLGLLRASYSMPRGPARIATVEAAVREADAVRDTDMAFRARLRATEVYLEDDEPTKALDPFWWCVAAHDRGEPDDSDKWAKALLWHFKGIVSTLLEHPDVPLDHVHAVLDDMERRYRAEGVGLTGVQQRRWYLAYQVGDAVTAAEQYRLLCRTSRDELSDCVGCELAWKVAHLYEVGGDEDAIAMAMPVLADGFGREPHPEHLLTTLLPVYLRTGRLAEAADLHRRSYGSLRDKHGSLSHVAEHLRFCALTGNQTRGLLLLERHLDRLDRPSPPIVDMEFSAAAARLLRHIAESGHGGLPVRGRHTGEVPAAELGAELRDRALAMAARFDTRNGTRHQSDRIRAMLEAEQVVEHLPLSGLPSIAHPRREAEIDPALSAAELAGLAERAARKYDDRLAAAAWQRFDEMVPDPSPELLARRLDERGDLVADDDPAAARADWTRAAALFAESGDEQRSLAALSRIDLLDVTTAPSPEALAVLQARVDQVLAVADQEQAARALARLSHAQRAVGQFAESVATLKRAANLAVPGELHAELALRLADALAASGPDNLGKAIDQARRAAKRFGELDAPEGACQAQLLLGRMHAAAGDLDAAAVALGAALASEDPQLLGRAHRQAGLVAAGQGRVADSHAAFAQAVAEFAAAGDPAREALARVDFADACLRLERPDDAADAIDEARLREAGDPAVLDRARIVLGCAHRDLGRLTTAIVVFEEVVASYAAQGDHEGLGLVHAHIAVVLESQNRDAEAAQRFDHAANAYAAAGRPLAEVENRRRAALAWHRNNDPDRALHALATATTTASTTANPDPTTLWHLATLDYTAAQILADTHHVDEALAHVEPAIPAFRSIGATTEATAAQILTGRLLLTLNRKKQAAKVLRAALRELPPEAEHQRAAIEDLHGKATAR